MKYLLPYIWIIVFFLLAKNATAHNQDSTRFTPRDTICECNPSIPLEIATSSLFWGLPYYWGIRELIDRDTTKNDIGYVIVLPSFYLLMYTVGPIAEWTSGCKGDFNKLLPFGVITAAVTTGLYYVARGPHKTNI